LLVKIGTQKYNRGKNRSCIVKVGYKAALTLTNRTNHKNKKTFKKAE